MPDTDEAQVEPVEETYTYTDPDDDVDLVTALDRKIKVRQWRIDRLRDQLDQLGDEVKRYERARKLLTGEKTPAKPGPKPTKALVDPERRRSTRIAPEKVEAYKAAVIEFAKTHEEFTQIQFRADPLSQEFGPLKSGTSSALFEMLRRDNVVRLARREGIKKYFRLTNAALNGDTSA